MQKMSIQLLSRLIPRTSARRHYATTLKHFESLYDILEVDPSCTKTEIRESWLKLSMMYHPDLNDSEEAREKFMKIKDAYKILNNDEERMKYNQKIGFYHNDPPPDYRVEWTLQGERDKAAAISYYRLWDEARIQKLMSSEKLREVNWKDKTPSERYRILLDEEQRQKEANKEEPEDIMPPEIMRYRTLGVVAMTVTLIAVAYRIVLIEESDEQQARIERRNKLKVDIVTKDGYFISRAARGKYDDADTEESYFTSISELRRKRNQRMAAMKEAEQVAS